MTKKMRNKECVEPKTAFSAVVHGMHSLGSLGLNLV